MDYKIADKLIELRKKQGLSQDELADKLSLSRQAISKWERAESLPDTENLIALSKLYNVTLDELIAREANVSTSEVKQPSTKRVNKAIIFLAVAVVSFVVSVICLAFVGYYTGELIEIHQPGYVFEPGDTFESERAGYITSLVISSVFVLIGIVVGVVALIKFFKHKKSNTKSKNKY